jgi:hypothetical protein
MEQHNEKRKYDEEEEDGWKRKTATMFNFISP